ncbi:hypothetical protein Q8A73_009510 [Channa argus]|nr:hypothetical protein Q8A73_009510 [Channa argus]
MEECSQEDIEDYGIPEEQGTKHVDSVASHQEDTSMALVSENEVSVTSLQECTSSSSGQIQRKLAKKRACTVLLELPEDLGDSPAERVIPDECLEEVKLSVQKEMGRTCMLLTCKELEKLQLCQTSMLRNCSMCGQYMMGRKCYEAVAVMKEYNLRRDFDTKHGAKYAKVSL